MPLAIKNDVRGYSTTTGTGTYTISGDVPGHFGLSDVSDGDTIYYRAQRGTQVEIGLGTVGGSGTTLTRDTILRSTNADAAVNWGAGTKEIALVVPAEMLDVLAELFGAGGTAAEFIRDTIGTALKAGDGIEVTVDDGADTITVALAALTADRAMITDGSGIASMSAVTATELGYVSGATSNLQAQITALQALTIRQPAVIARVDNTAAPPTEVSGDRYLLDNSGGSHAGWDGAAANDIVEFDGAAWVATTPSEGWVVYVDATDTDWLAVDDGTLSWQERTAAAITLNGLLDVVISSPTSGQVLRYNGATWVNAAIVVSDLSDPENLSLTASQISDWDEAVDDRVNTLLIAGSNVTLTYDDGANTLTIDVGSEVGQLSDLSDVNDTLTGNAGDILYHDGTEWTDLPAGDDGEVLVLESGLPAWGTGSATARLAPSLAATATWIGAPCRATVNNGGNASISANTLTLVPVLVPYAVTASKIGFSVALTGTAANARVGIYQATDGLPGSLLLDAGTVSVGSTGDKEVSFSQALTAGLYFVAILLDGTCSLYTLQSTDLLYHFGLTGASPNAADRAVGLYRSSVTYGALPAAAGTMTGATTLALPNLALRVTS